MVRARLALLPVLAALLAGLPAHAQQRDTLESGSGSFARPVLATAVFGGDVVPTDPLFGTVHVAWTRDLALRHAWKLFEPWQIESVADTAVSYDIGVNGDGHATIAYSDSSGRVVFAERTPTGWVRDTVVTVPGSLMRVTVAPRGEPVVAWNEYLPSDGLGNLRFARRSSGIWTIVDVDSFLPLQSPSLVIGGDGRPRIGAAVLTDTGPFLFKVFAFEGAGPAGPFTRQLIDPEGVGPVSMAWDDVHQRPLVAYTARRSGDADSHYAFRFAWRDAASTWSWQELNWVNASSLATDVAIGLDPLGTVGVMWNTLGTEPHFSRQPAGVPSMPFDPDVTLPGPFGVSALFSVSAVASHQQGLFDLCWREPRSTAPFAIIYEELQPVTTSVPESPLVAMTHLDLAPTPRSAGDPVRLRWSQARAAEARLVAVDLAGRVVMNYAAGRLAAGEHEHQWNPAALAPGVYWIALQLDGKPVARRVLISR